MKKSTNIIEITVTRIYIYTC